MKLASLLLACGAISASLLFATEPAQRAKPKSPSARTPAAPQKPVAAVPVMEAPPELKLSKADLSIAPGDTWTYLISSSDPSLDLKVLAVTVKESAADKTTFDVRLAADAPWSVEIPAKEMTWFAPVETETGVFGLKALGDDYPTDSRPGVTWNRSARFFKYDDAGNRTGEEGYVMSSGGPRVCAVPAGVFPCAEIERNDFGKPGVQSFMAIASKAPAAIRSRVRRAGGTGMILFELLSIGAAVEPAAEALIPKVERQKAIEWIKTNNKFGEHADIVENVVFLLHDGVRTYPKAGIRISVGSDVTKDGRAYRLDWRGGKLSLTQLRKEDWEKTTGLTRIAVP